MIEGLRKAQFTIEGFDRTFEGYKLGNTVASVTAPYFEKKVADEICAMLNEKGDHLKYKPAVDGYYVMLSGAVESEMYFSVVLNGLRLYGLGAGLWEWNEVVAGRKTIFEIDNLDKSFEGYSFDERWNGWAVPYFTKEVADKVAEELTNEDEHTVYDEEKDAYLVTFDEDEEPEVFPGEVINGMKLYSIGGYSWCWNEVEPSDYLGDLERFETHLHETVEGLDALIENIIELDVTIKVDGQSITMPLNADMYEALVGIMKDEIKYVKENGGQNNE